MATIKTPTLEQWRKLCEMAGFPFECDTPYGLAYRFSDGEQAQVMSVGLIPHNTDALMRLMGKLFYGEEPKRSGHELRLTAFAVHGKGHSRSSIECAAFVVNEDPAERYRLAACDILAQLAEAEGIQ